MNVLSITGMHRSGTSLTANLMHKSGLFLGDNLMEGGFDNVKGHFEDYEILKIHEEDLKYKSIDTNGILGISNMYLSFDKKTEPKIKTLLNKRISHQLWGWKEPRSILYLENWKKDIPQLKCLCIYRHYDEVVDSLLRRYKHKITNSVSISKWRSKVHLLLFPFRKLQLKHQYYNAWFVYNKLMVDFIQKYPNDTLIFSLDEVLVNFDEVLSKLDSNFDMKLNKIDVSEIHDPKLLKKPSSSVRRWYSKKKLEQLHTEMVKLSKFE